jgi:hypothetical protein
VEMRIRRNRFGMAFPCNVLCAALIAASVAGCSDATGPETAVSITTPSPTIVLQATPQGPVLNTLLTVKNTSAYPLAWTTCGVTLEKEGMPALPPGKSGWEGVWSRACYILEVATAFSSQGPSTLPAYPDAVLQPGQSTEIQIVAPVGQPPYQSFDGQPGQYRFFVPLSLEVLGVYRTVPHEMSVSAAFSLQPAQ